MREELDQRIKAALLADVHQLPLLVTEAMIEERLERRLTSSLFAMLGGLAAGAVVLAMLALALSGLVGLREVGPPVRLAPAPDIICAEGWRGEGGDCHAGAEAALESLPPGAKPPVRAVVLRGRAFTCTASCAEDIRHDATVVLEMGGDDPDLFVPVVLNSGGGVSAGGAETVPGGEFDADDAAQRASWQYVALGTGFTGSASWPGLYADYAAEDLGVSVLVQNRAGPRGPLRADQWLERIRTDDELRKLIAQAELITVGPALAELREPMLAFVEANGSCGGEDDQDCIRTAMAELRADWEGLLDELLNLRSPDEANIVVITQAAWLADWACGNWGTPCWEVLVRYWVDFYDFVAESAQERGLKVADTLGALHAPGVFDGPVNPAYVAPNGMDLTYEGSAVVAEVIRGVGY